MVCFTFLVSIKDQSFKFFDGVQLLGFSFMVYVLCSKETLPLQGHKDDFFFWKFHGFTFRSVIHLGLIFVYGVRYGLVRVHHPHSSIPRGHPVEPSPFVEKIFLSPLNCLSTFVKKLAIYMWESFWTLFCSIDLYDYFFF